MIADPATTEDRRALAREKLDMLEAVVARNAPKRWFNIAGRRRSDPASDRISQAISPTARESQNARSNQILAAPWIVDANAREVPVGPKHHLPDLQTAAIPLNANRQQVFDNVDSFEQFSVAALWAISDFADQQFAAMAARVRFDMRRQRATGIFGDDYGHRTLWDEYCYEVRHGPTMMLQRALEDALQACSASRIAALERSTAVLLTIAAQYDANDLKDQDGGVWNEELLHDSVRSALHPLADELRW